MQSQTTSSFLSSNLFTSCWRHFQKKVLLLYWHSPECAVCGIEQSTRKIYQIFSSTVRNLFAELSKVAFYILLFISSSSKTFLFVVNKNEMTKFIDYKFVTITLTTTLLIVDVNQVQVMKRFFRAWKMARDEKRRLMTRAKCKSTLPFGTFWFHFSCFFFRPSQRICFWSRCRFYRLFFC